MTVCVAVKVRDCVVFVADSATSLTGKDASGNEHVVNVYNHADKVFNLHKNLPIAAMTAGIGNFGGSSISTISKDLRALLMNDSGDYLLDESKYTIEDVAEKARKYLYEDRFETLADKPKGSVAKLETPCVTRERIGDIAQKFVAIPPQIDVYRSLLLVPVDAR